MRVTCLQVERNPHPGRELARCEIEVETADLNFICDARILDGGSDLRVALPSSRWAGRWTRPVHFITRELWDRLQAVALAAYSSEVEQ